MNPLVQYAESFLGVPYVYGGNHRFEGLDCSGFVCEVLRSVGLVGHREDLSAQGLFDKFQSIGTFLSDPMEGAIIFFGTSIKDLDHVALALSRFTLIEAGGGSAKTLSFEEAYRVGACVRERFVGYRRDMVAMIYPPYPWDVP